MAISTRCSPSRRLERECARNLELIRLLGRLKPDFKTIADFRRDNGPAIRKVCRQFVALCRHIALLDASPHRESYSRHLGNPQAIQTNMITL